MSKPSEDVEGPSDKSSRISTKISAGLGMPKALFALVLVVAVIAAGAAGAVSAWNLIVAGVTFLSALLVIALIAAHSQADLIRFKKERGRWPHKDELDAWNRELHGRRVKTKRVAAAVSGAKVAERVYRDRVRKAEHAVQAARRGHANAIAGATRALSTVQKTHDAAVAEATAALVAWRNPGRGNRITTFKDLELYQHALVIRRQVVPILNAHAAVAGNFLTIQIAGAQKVVKLTNKEVAGGLQFSSQVAAAAAAEMAFERERPAAIPAAEQYLRHVAADTAAIESARLTVATAEQDPELLAGIKEAERHLAAAQADTAAVGAAQSVVQEQQGSIVEPMAGAPAPNWLPRTSNFVASIVGVVLMAAIIGGIGAVATRYQPESTASVREIATPTPPEQATISEAPPMVATPCATAAPTSSPPISNPSAIAAPATQPQAPAIVGFGATDGDWNAHHRETSGFAPHAVYDADPSLPQVNGHVGSRYFAVNHMNGRVLAYEMSLHPGTPIGAAKVEGLHELPGDVGVVWFKVKDTCAMMEVKSATLGSVLADPKIGDPEGLVLIALSTNQADGSNTYNASNVDDLILTLGSYATPGDAPAC